MKINKFDILFVDFNPKKGSTQSGIRPCVVIQNNLFNNNSNTIIIVPLTSSKKKIFPSEFLIQPSKQNKLNEESRCLGSQIITLDKKYIIKKIGILESKYFKDILSAINISLDLENQFLDT